MAAAKSHNYANIQQQDIPITIENHDGMHLKCIQACSLSKHYKCWILTISIWSWIVGQIWCLIINIATNYENCASICNLYYNCDKGYISLIIISILLGSYLIETCYSTSCRYLFSDIDNDGCREYIERIKQTKVKMWSKIDCYHMEQTSPSNTAQANAAVLKKYTHSATHKFHYAHCKELSEWNMSEIIGKISKYGVVNVVFKINTEFVNEKSENEYNRQLKEFIDKNNKDTYYDIKHWIIPSNLQLQSFELQKENWNRSRYLNQYYYLLASMILCLPCYKIWITKIIGDNKYKTWQYVFSKELHAFIDTKQVTLSMFRALFEDILFPPDVCQLITNYCGDMPPIKE